MINTSHEFVIGLMVILVIPTYRDAGRSRMRWKRPSRPLGYTAAKLYKSDKAYIRPLSATRGGGPALFPVAKKKTHFWLFRRVWHRLDRVRRLAQ